MMEAKIQFGLFLILSVIVVVSSQICHIPSNNCPIGSEPRVLEDIGLGCYYKFCNIDADVATINLQQCFHERPIIIYVEDAPFSTEIVFPLCLDMSVAGLLGSSLFGAFVPEGVPVKLNAPNQLQTSFEFPDIQCESMVDSSQYVLNLPASLAKVKKFGKSGKCYTNNIDYRQDLAYIPVDSVVKMTNNVTIIDIESEAGASSRSYSISFLVPQGGDAAGFQPLPIAVTRVFNIDEDTPSDRFSATSKIIVDFGDAADAE